MVQIRMRTGFALRQPQPFFNSNEKIRIVPLQFLSRPTCFLYPWSIRRTINANTRLGQLRLISYRHHEIQPPSAWDTWGYPQVANDILLNASIGILEGGFRQYDRYSN